MFGTENEKGPDMRKPAWLLEMCARSQSPLNNTVMLVGIRKPMVEERLEAPL